METQKLFEEANSIAASKNDDIISKLISRLESEPKICMFCQSKIHRIKQKIEGAKIAAENVNTRILKIASGPEKYPIKYWYKSNKQVVLSKGILCRQLRNKYDRLMMLAETLLNKLNTVSPINLNEFIKDCFCESQSNKDLLDILIKYI